MKTLSKLVCFLSLFLPLTASFADPGHDWGGPSPMFKDVSGTLVKAQNTVYTEGGVQDFVYLDDHHTIVYRNDANELFTTRLGKTESQYLNKMDAPIARLVDSDERYIVADGVPRAYDLRQNRWTEFMGPMGPIAHLFWWRPLLQKRLRLVSLTSDFGRNGDQNYRIFTSFPGDTDPGSCQITIPSDYRLVKGMVKRPLQWEPRLVFFKEEPLPMGGKVIRFRAYSTYCHVMGGPSPMLLPDIPWETPLEDAYYFPAMKKIAIKFDHPTKNLAWADVPLFGEERADGSTSTTTPTHCQFFDVQNLNPIFVSDSRPVLATLSPNHELTLYNLERLEKARLLPKLSVSALDPHTISLSNDGHHLFVSPDTGGCGREIYDLSLAQRY